MTTSRAPTLAPTRLRSSEIRDLLDVVGRPGMLSLAGGLPGPECLPRDRIAVAAARAVAVAGPHGPPALQYGPTEGLEVLRDVVAPGTAGSPALGDPASVLVTTGAQQGLHLVVTALTEPGDTVVVEDPVYLGARQVLDAGHVRTVGVAADHDGLAVDELARALGAGLRPRLVYLVPNHSNPSGATLTVPRRAALADLAMRHGFVVVEDDPYHGLGFAGVPPPPVRAFAPDHTVTLASASKFVAPGLRVGWLGAPPGIRRRLVLAKQALDLHTSTLDQMIVADVLADGDFVASHLAAVRARYRERAAALHTALAGAVEARPPTGGMFLWGRATVPTRPALARAIAAGVAFVPGDACTVAVDGSRSLRLGFATLGVHDLRTAAGRLRAALAGGDDVAARTRAVRTAPA